MDSAGVDPSTYYEDRPVSHTAQGDLYAQVPFVTASPVGASEVVGRGSRKRPIRLRGFSEPDDYYAAIYPREAYGLVCSYTCGFVAQPPGTSGYAHPYRLIAPVLPLSSLVSKYGLQNGDARRLMSSRLVSGLMWLPKPPDADEPEPTSEYAGHWAALLYRMSSVAQELLDSRKRVARLSTPAQRILIAGAIQVVSPHLFDPFDDTLPDPDMTDSWTQG